MEGMTIPRSPSGTAPYLRVREIARGGMGRVDLVVRREGSFARAYAMKRILVPLADDDEMRSMFLNEARIAGLIRHANVVSVLDVGADDEGPYLVMDFVEGVALSNVLGHRAGRLLPLPFCLEIARQIALGLHAAHELASSSGKSLEVVHRDVSPQNVLVGADGIARVTDFGIVRALDRSNVTRTGVLKGKYGYMSPEQLRFEPLDRRSDLFSLGVVLFEMISGRRLYGEGGADAARRILDEPPPDLGEARQDLPIELVELGFELLAKDRAMRPADARAVARRLEGILASLDAEERRFDVAAYLHEHFGEPLAAQRAMLAEAVADPEGTAAALAPAPAEPPRVTERIEPVHDATTIALDGAADDAETAVQRPPSRAWIAVALGAALVAVAGGALWIASHAETVEERSPSPAGAVAIEPVAPTPSFERGEARDAVPIAGEAPETTTAAEEAAAPSGGPETEAERQTTRRRTKRSRAPAKGGPAGGGVPSWDWE